MSDLVERLRDADIGWSGDAVCVSAEVACEAADEIEKLRSQLVKGEILWCCHVRGPDDIYAAPDYATALAWADMLNAINWRGDARYPKPVRYENPKSYADCLIKATPAPWPYSAESHAADLPKNVAGFAEPSITQSDDPDAGLPTATDVRGILAHPDD